MALNETGETQKAEKVEQPSKEVSVRFNDNISTDRDEDNKPRNNNNYHNNNNTPDKSENDVDNDDNLSIENGKFPKNIEFQLVEENFPQNNNPEFLNPHTDSQCNEPVKHLISKDAYGSYEFDQFDTDVLERIAESSELKRSKSCDMLGFESLSIKRKIGKGAFGEVFLATVWGTDVAVKTFPQLSEKIKSEFRDEVYVLKGLRHPNCVQFMGFTVEPFSIITEYMDQGSLFDLLRDRRVRINGAMVIHVSRSVAGGLLYLHSNDVLHKDIKSSNVLVSENWRKIKLADFGISLNSSYIGDATYRAPEASLLHYSRECDIYSYGMLLWELLTRRAPFFPTNNQPSIKEILQMTRDGYRPEIPKYSPPWLRKLIQNCWNQTPENRPTVDDILLILGAQASNENLDQDSQVISEDYLAALEEKIETSLPYGVRKARFYSGIFNSGTLLSNAIDWIVTAIFGKVVGIASAGYFLRGDSNQWIAIFGYDTIDDVRKADQFAVRHKDFSQKIDEINSTPVVREELELNAWYIHKNPKAAIVTHVHMKNEHQSECFKIYDLEFIPKMKEEHSDIWRGSLSCTDYYKGKVYLINFFDSRENAARFLRTEFISKTLISFKPHITSRPISEVFSVSYGSHNPYYTPTASKSRSLWVPVIVLFCSFLIYLIIARFY